MKKVTSFEEACTLLGIDPNALPDVSNLPEEFRNAIICQYKLMVITKAVNEGKEPNWADNDEPKYFPWYEVVVDKSKASGFGLSFGGCACRYTHTTVGSRLSSTSREAAIYIGETFKDLYEGLFLKS